jgi:hypothetical protein
MAGEQYDIIIIIGRGWRDTIMGNALRVGDHLKERLLV